MKMIKTLKIKSFKSFVDETIPLRPLTLLSGLNSSGKSSIIQSVRMFHQAANGQTPLLEGLGTVSDIRSQHSSKTSQIEIRCFFDADNEQTLTLDDTSCIQPGFAPEQAYVGADRLGRKTSLPLNRELNVFPTLGNQCEFVLDFIQKLSNTIIPSELIHPKSEGNTLEYNLVAWLGEISPGTSFNFNSYPKTDIAHSEIDNFRPTNVGFGLSYTLPVIAGALGMSSTPPVNGWEENWGPEWQERKKKNGYMLVVENPEAHLHPKGQTAMGQMLALAASTGLQVLIETHSDHLMDGIRLAVKNNELSSSDAIFHYLSKSQDGISEIETPEIKDDGKLTFWPNGFFDQTLKNKAKLAKKS